MRRVVSAVVVYRRRAELSASRQITSSRQSPMKSAVSAGVDLVPLCGAHSLHESKVAPPYFAIEVLSSSSRVSSPSHQIKKLIEPGAPPRFLPVAASKSPVPPAAHISA